MELTVGGPSVSIRAMVCAQFHAAPDFYDPERTRTYHVSGGEMRAMAGPTTPPCDSISRFYGHGWLPEHYPEDDAGFIAIQSASTKYTVGLWWEQAGPVWGNAHLSTLCIHADPHYGRLEPRVSRERRGKLYLMAGGPSAALARFHQESSKDE